MQGKLKTFFKETSFAVVSQSLSMAVGFALSIILPKFISVESYGYWQLFILYTGYVGFLHFGFIDGLYLKIGGEKFDNLDKNKLYPSMALMIILQVIIAIIVIGTSCFVAHPVKRVLFAFLGLYVFVDNTYKLMSFILMATGRINFYSKTVVIDKVLVAIMMTAILFLNPGINVGYLIGAFVLSHLAVLFVTWVEFKGVLLQGIKKIREIVPYYLDCVKVGAILMFANLCGSFIVGSGRFVIESFWDISVFAKVSLALALSSFMMAFISQISYVLFPYLRNASQETQSKVLSEGTFLMTLLGLVLFSMFFPLYFIIKLWLPQYQESLMFLLYIAPISLYEIKTTVLYNTFFRNLNKVKDLFYTNLASLILGCVFYAIAVLTHNIMLMIIGMLSAVIFRCLIMQVYLFKYYKVKLDSYTYVEFGITCFLLLSYAFGGLVALAVCYGVSILLFFVVYMSRLHGVKALFAER